MDDPVDRLIEEREGMDAGFPRSVLLSIGGHLLLVGAAAAAPFVFPSGPVLKVAEGFAVPLPRGGGGSSAPAAPPATAPAAKPSEAPPEAPAPRLDKVLKPPKEEERRGLPELESKKGRRKSETLAKAVAPAPMPGREASTSSGARGGTGSSSTTPGLDFGPPGVGVPDGTDTGGDWYLAGVQQKIWMIWTQQIKVGFAQPVAVSFTILADGTVADVRITQSCGATMVDLAAQRAVMSAAPFGPLPKDYGTTRKTIQALFRPTN